MGAFGNLVHRSLVFFHKSFGGKVPEGEITVELRKQMEDLYFHVGNKIERGVFKSALEEIFASIRSANKYFDQEQPWATVKNDEKKCKNTLYTCVQIIANLSNLFSPFIPFVYRKIKELLQTKENKWKYSKVSPFHPIKQAEILFERIDKQKIEEEVERMKREERGSC